MTTIRDIGISVVFGRQGSIKVEQSEILHDLDQ